MELGIKCLRDMVVSEIIYGYVQTSLDPGKLPCQKSLLKKLIQCPTPTYAHTLAGRILGGDSANHSTVSKSAKQLRQFRDSISQFSLGLRHRDWLRTWKSLRHWCPGWKRGITPLFLNRPMSQPLEIDVFLGDQVKLDRGNWSLWQILCDQRENTDRWHGKPTSAFWARIQKLQGGNNGEFFRRLTASVSQEGSIRPCRWSSEMNVNRRDGPDSNTSPCVTCGHHSQH